MADKNLKDISQDLQDVQANLTSMASILSKGIRDSLSDSLTDIHNMVDAFEKGKDVSKEMESKLIAFQKQSNKLGLEQVSIEAKLANAQRNRNISLERKLTKQLQENKLAQKGLENQQEIILNLQKISEEEVKITEEKKKQSNLTDQIKKSLAGAIKPLTDLFTLAGILKAIVDGALRFNKTSVEISKNLGYAGNEADRVAANMQNIAFTSDNINVTLKSLGQAMSDLNTATGGVAEYSADALETQVMLTKQFGLTGEEAAGIYKFSTLTGKSSSQVNKEMVAAFASTRNMVKGSANFKTTMAEAAKVSGQLAANFRNNPAEITKAIVQAQALGTTLERTKSQGEKLLDFESSIESELKAELLTGQQMNLERARAAALAGDQVTVMKELANQGMTLQKFQGMNVLAQKAYAEALGLSADELSTQLNQQKIAQEQGKSLAQVQAEDLEKAQKRQNVQDRFNALVEKLMDMIGKIGIILNPFFRMFELITDNAYVLYTVLGLIALSRLPAIAKGFKGIAGDIKDSALNAKKLFSKEGRASLFGGGAEDAAKKAAGAGEKAGAGGPGAGEGIKGTLKGISSGIQSFSKVSPADIGKLALSALALVLLTPAVPALLLLQLVNGKLIQGALTGIGKGLSAMGKAMASAAPEILIAELLLAGLGLALWTFVPIVDAFGKVITAVFGGLATVIKAGAEGIGTIFSSLENVDVAKLLLVGPALIGIGLGLASLGAGGVIGAIGAFLGGDPIKKIERLAASGSGLQAAASGLQGVATALTQVASALSAIDTSKLEALGNFSAKMSVGSAVKGITDFITAPIKAIGGAIGGGGTSDNTAMITAINEVRDAVNKLYAKEGAVYLDSSKIGTAQVKGSYKMA